MIPYQTLEISNTIEKLHSYVGLKIKPKKT